MKPRIAKRKNQRRGASVIEFALIAPLFFIFVFGTIEFGRMLMVQQQLTAAARDGARLAIIDGSSDKTVKKNVEENLAANGVSGAKITLSEKSLDKIEHGQPITVTVSVSYGQVSWLPAPFFLGKTELSATATMRKETIH